MPGVKIFRVDSKTSGGVGCCRGWICLRRVTQHFLSCGEVCVCCVSGNWMATYICGRMYNMVCCPLNSAKILLQQTVLYFSRQERKNRKGTRHARATRHTAAIKLEAEYRRSKHCKNRGAKSGGGTTFFPSDPASTKHTPVVPACSAAHSITVWKCGVIPGLLVLREGASDAQCNQKPSRRLTAADERQTSLPSLSVGFTRKV
ncbi:hypothetical protein GE09DRAFT_316358 [Coniochaeta sp. 2T2.1]|nr:hypothetical protein GE09DRAFT_316358 [Coniochaeta sp. 2T2.1]